MSPSNRPYRARQERAGLLQLEVDLDPNGLPVLLDDLYGVQEIRTEPTAGLQRHLAEGAGPAGFGTPWPSANALLSRISFQLFASIIAWRTRTSLNGSRGARRIGPGRLGPDLSRWPRCEGAAEIASPIAEPT